MGLRQRMSCAGVQAVLPLFVGEDLPGDVQADVRLHLRGCHACQRSLAGYRQAGLALRAATSSGGIGEGRIDDEFFASLRGDTLSRAAAVPFPRPARGWARALRRVAVAGALIAAGMALAWLFLGEGDGLGTGLLRQPGLARAPGRNTPSVDATVPVSFSPAAQGLRGLQRLDLDPRWNDHPPRTQAKPGR